MRTKKDLMILGCVAAVLLVVGAFADLQISHALYNQESVFGKIFEAVGEFPASFIASFCAMSVAVVQKQQKGNIGFKCAGSFILALLFGLMAGMLPMKYFGAPMAAGVVLAIIIIAADLFMAKAVAKNSSEELYKAAVLGLELFLIVILVFNMIKLGWGRERYRHMAASGDFTGFSMWLIPQGLASGNEFMSFPSGHSANAAIVMWITLIPSFVSLMKGKETLLKVVAGVWIGCVMLSRIIMGAHFVSDVTMGMTISLVTFYLLYQRKYNKAV